MNAKKTLGQHFLMHARIAERIASVAQIEGQQVLEIGAGTGILTRALLARAKKVIAIETDRDLVPKLRQQFSREIESGKLELVEGDVRSFDPASIAGDYALVANIPYYLTGEILRSFLEAAHQPSSMTLLVQKEVAVRIARAKKESILSLSIKAYGTPKLEFTVPRGAFVPAPGVDSAVLAIRDISRANFKSQEAEERFFAFIKAGFAHKRKLLASNLEGAGLSASGIPPQARAEELSLGEWLALSAR